MHKTAAAVLLQFDGAVVDMAVKGRVAALQQLAGLLYGDEVIRRRGGYFSDDLFKRRSHDGTKNAIKELGKCVL